MKAFLEKAWSVIGIITQADRDGAENISRPDQRRNFLITLLSGLLLIGLLAVIPTGYEDAVIYKGAARAVCTVKAVDNSSIIRSGLISSGEQSCTLYIKSGLFKGRTIQGVNFLSGSPENDKVYEIGDTAYVTISHTGSEITQAVMTDHFRLNMELILLLLFFGFLLLFAGRKGFQAIFTFMITIEVIWKVLIPCFLKGMNPVWIGLGAVTFLTCVIIFFVYGADVRTLVAVGGSMLGILTTCLLGISFTGLFDLHGAIMQDSVSLLYSGYQSLDLTKIFMAAIFIGASGSMMDLSVDITSAVYEVCEKKPTITRFEAMKSGMNVGRAAMGTMTTTLLLAYSGSYITQMMVFMAQGTPVDHIFNYRYVAAEILHTIAGSFGLVTVAPFTAIVAGWVLAERAGKRKKTEEISTERAGLLKA